MVVHTLIPAIERLRCPSKSKADLFEFKASLVYRESSRIAEATQRSHVLKKITNGSED